MNRTLHDGSNSKRILQITADTMLLVRRDGLCVDIDTHSSLWFLQEEKLLNKNLFELMPKQTLCKIKPLLEEVFSQQTKISSNFQLELGDETHYFKCIMSPYDDLVLCQYRDITVRSNMKMQLERVNRELVEIQKAAQIGQWKFSYPEEIISYSGYTSIICSESKGEITLQEYSQLIVEEDLPLFTKWKNKVLIEENDDSIDYRINYKGQTFYVRIKAYIREEYPDGGYCVEGYMQNVTDMQRRRNDINTLTHAINNAKESIFAAKEDGTLIFANRQFKNSHCLPDQVELEKLKIYNIVGDMQSIEGWQRRYKQAQPGKSANFIAYHPLKYDKKTLALEGVVYHITNDEGEVSYWSFAHDISERLHYESQIKRLNRVMDATMQNLPASIVVKDINNDFRYVYRNRKLYSQDISVSDAIGKNDFDFHPPQTAERKRREDEEIATTGKGIHRIMETAESDGTPRILDKRKIKVESEEFSPVIISIEWDITPLELMRRALTAQKEKAETSDKLKSAFLANMSHEIRTPLNAIVGFSRIIAESSEADERKMYYDIVEANNARLLTLINEILDLSKIESGIVEFTYAPVKLDNLCKEIYDAHVFRCPKEVELIAESGNDCVIIDSDKNRVFQVVSNLIGNAFKFTTSGSISYGYRQEEDFIRFHVRDTGTGIEPEKVAKVFERFVKVNNFAQGTGLGLSICKTIIERLGGEISVTSELGKGSEFAFILPARTKKIKENICTEEVDGEKAIFADDSPLTTSRIGKPDEEIVILIAEDTDSNYNLLEAILGKTYHVERAIDGMEAVTLFDELQPDLILMDIKMPNLNGLEATKIIRELSTTVPIIAQSAYAYERDQKAAAEAGCNDFISKPIDQDKLKKIIKKYI